MEIEVGMYIRTKWGYICELININEFREPSMKYGVEANYLRDVMFIGEEDILKASDNIIELIEVGDILDCEFGGIVLKAEVLEEDNILGIGWDNNGDFVNLESVDIKSIVTKEQFESCKYKVGE